VGVHHYPREAGVQTGAHLSVILKAFYDLFRLRQEIIRTEGDGSQKPESQELAKRRQEPGAAACRLRLLTPGFFRLTQLELLMRLLSVSAMLDRAVGAGGDADRTVEVARS